MNAKNIARIILGIIAILLAYFLFESIMKPQRFEVLKSKKEAEVVTRLKDIRTAELAYKGVYGHFCATMDSLIIFLENGHLPTVKKTGEIPDSLTEAEALKLGLIRRDTIYDDAYTVLFPNHTDKTSHLTNLRYIPFTNRTKEFTIETGFIERSNVQVPVIEVGAFLADYMIEPEYKQFVRNAIKRQQDMQRFPGRKFGSMDEPQTEGNWE